jgi:hypothetical protein
MVRKEKPHSTNSELVLEIREIRFGENEICSFFSSAKRWKNYIVQFGRTTEIADADGAGISERLSTSATTIAASPTIPSTCHHGIQ